MRLRNCYQDGARGWCWSNERAEQTLQSSEWRGEVLRKGSGHEAGTAAPCQAQADQSSSRAGGWWFIPLMLLHPHFPQTSCFQCSSNSKYWRYYRYYTATHWTGKWLLEGFYQDKISSSSLQRQRPIRIYLFGLFELIYIWERTNTNTHKFLRQFLLSARKNIYKHWWLQAFSFSALPCTKATAWADPGVHGRASFGRRETPRIMKLWQFFMETAARQRDRSHCSRKGFHRR